MRNQRTSQPQYPVPINRSHAAAAGIGLAVVGGIPVNLANGKVAETFGNLQTTVVSSGRAYGPFPTASDRLRVSAPLPRASELGGCLLVSGMVDGYSSYQILLCPEAGSYALTAYVETGGTVSIFYRGHRYSFTSIGSTPPKTPFTFVISSANWASGDASQASLFIGGKDYSAAVTYVGFYGAAYGDDRLSVGADYTNGNPSTALYLNVIANWPDRHLPKHLLRALSANPHLLFPTASRHPFIPSTVTAQFLRPVSDISNSGWSPSSGADLFPMLNEAVRNDTTCITATAVGATFEVLLGTSAGDPQSSINHLPRIVMSAGSGGIILRLKQGTTVIKEWTYSSLATSDTLYEPTLSSGEIDVITDYTDLRLYGETIA